MEQALVPAATAVAVESSPIPMFGGPQMALAFAAYRDLQQALDAAMPDQIMQLEGRAFRKKGYWRAVAVAFNLSVEPIRERRRRVGAFEDGRANFGYLVTYRATRGSRSTTGDGSCFAIEKAARFKCPHPAPGGWKGKAEHFPHESCPDYDADYRWRELPAQASEHNVRSHAHTRAFNRAVSNLVGFGEVSAEEVERDERDDTQGHARTSRRPSAPANRALRDTDTKPRPAAPETIGEQPRRAMFALARSAGWTDEEIKSHLLRHGFANSYDVTIAAYDLICKEFAAGVDGTRVAEGVVADGAVVESTDVSAPAQS